LYDPDKIVWPDLLPINVLSSAVKWSTSAPELPPADWYPIATLCVPES